MGADKRSVAAVEVEPISPELALVCPELRERALALLPDVAWRAFVQEVRAITVREPAVAAGRDRARQVAMPLVQGLMWVLGALVFGVTATLVLTLIADAIR